MNKLPHDVLEVVAGRVGTIRAAESRGGGCIANATRIDTADGAFFLKWARSEAGNTFEAEAAGLRALRGADAPLTIPQVLDARNADDHRPGFLLLEWIEPAPPADDHDERLGVGLAALHSHVEPGGKYGFGEDNFIGRLPQRNAWREDWPSFFSDNRLAPQIEMATGRGVWRRSWDRPLMRLLGRLAEILPATPPAAICHGDLWSGNAMAAAGGAPALIDPATYFGHAETDLAMMTLFGGFGRQVFTAYHEVHPRRPGHEEREAVYQLYHLINHLNHFGSGYADGVERALRRVAP